MKPFFKYFGSKYLLAKDYPKPIGVVCESFAGSACYSLFYDVEKAILIDKDERVIKIWEYLINVDKDEILNLPNIKPGTSIDDYIWPTEGAKLLASCWVNTSPFRKTYPSIDKCLKYKWDKKLWGDTVKIRIANQLEKIRNWKAICTDYQQVPENVDTLFIDPPYQKEGIAYKYGTKLIDYDQLGEWVKNRNEKLIIVCEQDGANWLTWNYKFDNCRRVARNNRECFGSTEVAYVRTNQTTPNNEFTI